MSTHTGYKPRKQGLYDAKIQREKLLRHCATVDANKAVKRDIMIGVFGGKARTSTGAMLINEIHVEAQARDQSYSLSYSDRGDFTNCYRGGFY